MKNEAFEQMIKDAVKEAVKEVLSHHICKFSDEELLDLRNLAYGTKVFKKSILIMVIGFIIAGITFGIQGIKNIINLIK